MSKPIRRAMIIKAAKPLFARKGFHNTTIEDIYKACEIAQGTLYLHFKNKHEIFRALVIDLLDRIQALIKPVYTEKPGITGHERNEFLEFIKEKNLRILEAVNQDRDLFRILLLEAPGLNSEIDQILARMNGIMFKQIESELFMAQRFGMIRRIDTNIGANMVLGTMLMVILTCLIESDPPDLEELAEKVTDVQFFGIQKRPV